MPSVFLVVCCTVMGVRALLCSFGSVQFRHAARHSGLFAASSLAMILFAMLVRLTSMSGYLVPALPGVVIVAFAGFLPRALKAFRRASCTRSSRQSIPLLVFITSTALLVRAAASGVAFHSEVLVPRHHGIRPTELADPRVGHHVKRRGRSLRHLRKPIAAKQHYVVARKKPSRVNPSWMGGPSYTLKFQTPTEIAELESNDVGIGLGSFLMRIARYGNFSAQRVAEKRHRSGLASCNAKGMFVNHDGGPHVLVPRLPQIDERGLQFSDRLSPALYPGTSRQEATNAFQKGHWPSAAPHRSVSRAFSDKGCFSLRAKKNDDVSITAAYCGDELSA